MRISDGLEALQLTMDFRGRSSVIHPLLVWDEGEGATLVDTGFPGQFSALREAVAAAGVALQEIRRIILTHQDIDHIGNLRELVAASGAEVIAHAEEVPYIQGERPLLKADPKRLEAMLQDLGPEERERALRIFSSPVTARVDRSPADGEILPFHGGIRVIHTPGHTPGHICLYLFKGRLLVGGDELRVENGVLTGPSAANTLDMERAVASLQKLKAYASEVDYILAYHGGFYGPHAGSALAALAG